MDKNFSNVTGENELLNQNAGLSAKDMAKFVNDMTVWDIRMALDDMVHSIFTKEKWMEYNKLRSLERLYERATADGMIFSWEEARKRWVCEHDYSVFEELAGLDPMEHYDDNMRRLILSLRKKHSDKQMAKEVRAV